MVGGAVGDIGQPDGRFTLRGNIFQHAHKLKAGFNLVYLHRHRSKNRVYPDILIGDAGLTSFIHEVSDKDAPFRGIAGHSLSTPQQPNHSGIVFLDQGQFLLQSVRLQGDRINQRLSLTYFQPSLHSHRIGGIQR